MSRDFTPKQSLEAEKYTGVSLWDIMEGSTFTVDGKSKPFYTAEQIMVRKNYPLLGKLVNKFEELYARLSEVKGGLDILQEKDAQLAQFIETGKGDADSYLIKWFEGRLDAWFYYSEWNEKLFCDGLIQEARSIPQFVACLGCDNIIDILNSEPINGMLECPFCGFKYDLDPKTATAEEINKCFSE